MSVMQGRERAIDTLPVLRPQPTIATRRKKEEKRKTEDTKVSEEPNRIKPKDWSCS